MGAALELMIIPVLVLLAILVLGVLADFSAPAVVAASVFGAILVFALVVLLRKEKEWEGPREHHEDLDKD